MSAIAALPAEFRVATIALEFGSIVGDPDIGVFHALDDANGRPTSDEPSHETTSAGGFLQLGLDGRMPNVFGLVHPVQSPALPALIDPLARAAPQKYRISFGVAGAQSGGDFGMSSELPEFLSPEGS